MHWSFRTRRNYSLTAVVISDRHRNIGDGMIDWARVDELKNDFGEDDFLEIVEMFLHEVEEKLQSLPDQPVSQLSEDFHFLKGSAANLGFRKFQAVCSEYERAPHRDAIAIVQESFSVSKEAFMSGLTGAAKVA